MKFMTYELLARTQSENDAIANAAFDEWEKACAEYNKHVETIRNRLPKSVQSLLDNYNLHDAKVILAGVDGSADDCDDPSISMFLQLDEPRNRGLRLDYRPIVEPKVIWHKKNPKRNADTVFLYDEIDVVEVSVSESERIPMFTHSILAEEGMEMQLLFHSLTLRQYRRVKTSSEFFSSGHSIGGLEPALT
jgi:hypothetical protein